MAMINCTECNKEMSETAVACAHCGHVVEKPSRGLLGNSFKWMFIAFNIIMAIMVYMSMGHTEESNTAVQVGAGMGISMLGMMWAAGFMVLGAFTYFTRVK